MKKRFTICLILAVLFCLQLPLVVNARETTPSKYKWYLSLVAIFRDEADYLKEWIEYCHLIGFEHIYLYNNLSGDHYKEVLQPYVDSGLVELIEWPYEHGSLREWGRIQMNSYRDAVSKAKGKTQWLAIIDTDEFIVPNMHKDFTSMMHALDAQDKKRKYARYEISWVTFGTSDVYRVPEDKLMIEVLTKNEGVNRLKKSIVRPEYVGKEYNPHYTSLTGKKKVKTLEPQIAQINHYMYRDGHFLLTVKIPRRQKIGYDETTIRNWEAACCKDNQYSNKIMKFIPELRRRMGL